MIRVDLDSALETAIHAAIAGGKTVGHYFGTPPKARRIRTDRPPQIRPDRKANLASLKAIVRGVGQHRIPHVVSEEGITGKKNKEVLRNGEMGEYCWYIDPMDNSTTKKRTGYATSIGLVDPYGIPVIAAIYIPLEVGYELFWARQDEGAYVRFNRGSLSRIRVSDRIEIAEARVALGSRGDSIGDEVYGKAGIPDEGQSRIRISGGVKKGVEIARGNLDGWLACNGYDTHDICAAVCLVREAGGEVIYGSGEEVLFPNPQEARHEGLLWSNGQMTDLKREFLRNKYVKNLRGRFHDNIEGTRTKA
ncbi:MAG TPA: inositol monophosphatase family protein [Candidatus Nanoarchaeia archaeon]|nr:inositol monophosphatase family protein [Candidatus Nanoarchaeia archaeon]